MNRGMLLILSTILLLTACGGGGDNSNIVASQMDISIPSDLSIRIDNTPYKIPISVSCTGKDLFNPECFLAYARVTIANDYSYDIPLNIALKHKDKLTAENKLTVFSDIDLETPHFVFLTPDNPSMYYLGGVQYVEILASSRSKVVGAGEETCGMQCTCQGGGIYNENSKRCEILKPIGLACPSGYTEFNDLCIAFPTCANQCVGKKQYTFTVPEYTEGTLLVTDGTQSLTETSFGRLTGNGNGVIKKISNEEYEVTVVFNNAPLKGNMVIAQWLEPLRPISKKPIIKLYLLYGNILLELQDEVLMDSSGKVYGYYDKRTSRIHLVVPLGAKDGALIVKYGSDFYNLGGVQVGLGDGNKKILSLRANHQYLVKDSLKVFTPEQVAKILILRETVGEFTVEFEEPPKSGQPILASYMVTKVKKPVKVEFFGRNNELVYSQTLEMEVKR